MKFYHQPGACSLGIHVLLEEIGAPFEPIVVNLREGEQNKPAFVAINPKQKVPTLQRDDGSVLTEFPAIAFWLARTHADAKLLPADAEGQTRVLEAMDYVVGTIHMQGMARLFRPSNFTPNAADEEAVRARGQELVDKGLAVVNKALQGRDYLAGDFSIADAALFYVEFWVAGRMKQVLPPNCAAHYQRMLSRPAVQRIMKAEGLAA